MTQHTARGATSSGAARGSEPPAASGWLKSAESMWTALAIEPVTMRLAPPLARMRWVSPNRLTVLAAALGILSGYLLLRGELLAGGVLFQLRYLVDCLDGKVARLRRTPSARGAALDLAVDVLTITWNYAAISLYVVDRGAAPAALVASVVGTSAAFAWTLAYRKGIAGPADPDPTVAPDDGSLRTRYLGWMARHRSMPVPYAVEAEILALSLGPALGQGDRAVVVCLWVATAFYVAAVAVNLRRIWRIAGAIDAGSRQQPSSG